MAEYKELVESDVLETIIERVRTLDNMHYVAFKLLKDTGMRPSELVTIETRYLDLDNRRVISGMGKMTGYMTFFFSEECKAILKDYLETRLTINENNPYLFPRYDGSTHIATETLQKTLEKVRGKTELTTRSFRRIFMMNLRKKGCSI